MTSEGKREEDPSLIEPNLKEYDLKYNRTFSRVTAFWQEISQIIKVLEFLSYTTGRLAA